MKTKPPLTLKGLLKWTSDITRELYGCLKDGSLKYPQVKSKTDLLVLAHPKYIGSIAHVTEDNNPYMGVQDESGNKTVWKKVALGETLGEKR